MRATINAILFGLALGASLALAELVLRIATPFPIHSAGANRIPHEVLGYVMDPALAEVDELGFRNAGIPGPPELVTLGDSHTWGYNVVASESAATRPFWRTRLAERGIDALVCDEDGGTEGAAVPATGGWMGHARALAGWAYQHTATASAIRYHGEGLREALLASWGESRPDDLVVRYGPHVTRLSQSRRFASHLDTARPRIDAALRVVHSILGETITGVQEQGLEVRVLFIPSKEAVLYDHLVAEGYEADPHVAVVVERERQLVDRLSLLFDSLGVATHFFAGRMAEAVARGRKVYPASPDRHPLAPGYALYAEAARELLEMGGDL